MDLEKAATVLLASGNANSNIKVRVGGKDVDVANVEVQGNSLQMETEKIPFKEPPKKFIDSKVKANRVKKSRSMVKQQKKSRKINRRKG